MNNSLLKLKETLKENDNLISWTYLGDYETLIIKVKDTNKIDFSILENIEYNLVNNKIFINF